MLLVIVVTFKYMQERHGEKIELKLASLGKKLHGWIGEIELPQNVQRCLDISGLTPLQRKV
jgi:hypothetical protein